MFSQINKRTLQKNPCTLGISEKTSTHCTHAIKKPSSKSHPLKLSPLLKHVYIILQSCVRMLKVTIHKFIFHLIIKSFFPVCVASLKKKKKRNLNQFNYFLLCGIVYRKCLDREKSIV